MEATVLLLRLRYMFLFFSSVILKATWAQASSASVTYEQTSISLSLLFHSQTDEERQQALQAFTAQSFLSSPQQNNISSCGSGASAPAFPSPTSSSDHRAKMKRGPRKNQNEKYRLKYLRLRKAARAMIFVSELLINEKLCQLMHIFFHILQIL